MLNLLASPSIFLPIKLLQDEMTSQQQQYENFIQSGLAILDKSDPESPDADTINKQIETINKAWDKLHNKLGERESNLKDMLGLSTKYYENLQQLSEWIPEVGVKLEMMPAVSAQPEVIASQRDALKVRQYWQPMLD